MNSLNGCRNCAIISGVRRGPAEGARAGPFEGKFPEGEYELDKNLGRDFDRKSVTGPPLQKFLYTPLTIMQRKIHNRKNFQLKKPLNTENKKEK